MFALFLYLIHIEQTKGQIMNLINNQFELWYYTGYKCNAYDTTIAVSNCGRMRLKDGTLKWSGYKKQHARVHRLIACVFIPKTEEDLLLNRTYVDHITHTPVGMNINDVRNMRWCTPKENMNFEEARANLSETLKGNCNSKGKPTSEFGKKFKEHFCYIDSKSKLYNREKVYFHRHGKCRWE